MYMLGQEADHVEHLSGKGVWKTFSHRACVEEARANLVVQSTQGFHDARFVVQPQYFLDVGGVRLHNHYLNESSVEVCQGRGIAECRVCWFQAH